ncbi:MAG: chromosomal replication initiator protein, partial [Planctomycetota bacterium]
MKKNYDTVWHDALKIIQDNVSIQSFKTWFEPIIPVALNGNVITIQVPSQFFYEWIEEHYVDLLRKTIQRELGPDARLEYRIVVENSNHSSGPYTIEYPNYNTGTNENQDSSIPLVMGKNIVNPFIIPGLKKINIDPQLKASYNFET